MLCSAFRQRFARLGHPDGSQRPAERRQPVPRALRRDHHVQEQRTGQQAQVRVQATLQEHHQNYGLRGLRQVPPVGQAADAGSGHRLENPIQREIRLRQEWHIRSP